MLTPDKRDGMNNIGLIKTTAYRFHKTTGLPYTDLLSEAGLAYTKAIKDYDPERGALSTLAVVYMTNHLSTYVTDEKWRPKETPVIQEVVDETDEFRRKEFLQELTLLSWRTQIACRMVLSNQDVYAEMPPKLARGKLRRELIASGWSWNEVYTTFREIRDFLRKF
jgi:DNA-directed RNA polymerase specialized sigma subunit